METFSWRAALLTAFAPTAWGTTYLVTERLLPPDRPLLSATIRGLPTGLVLLAFTRRLPSREWWWRSLVMGLCNIGLFFPLLFLAAYRLPGGLASTLQATSPLAVMALAALLIGERWIRWHYLEGRRFDESSVVVQGIARGVAHLERLARGVVGWG